MLKRLEPLADECTKAGRTASLPVSDVVPTDESKIKDEQGAYCFKPCDLVYLYILPSIDLYYMRGANCQIAHNYTCH